MNISSILQDQAKNNGTGCFISDMQINFSYGQTEELVNQVTGYLLSRGVNRGERVAIQLYNSIDFVVIYNAVIRIGGIIVPMGFTLKPREVNTILSDCCPMLFIQHTSINVGIKKDLQFLGEMIIIDENELAVTGNWKIFPEAKMNYPILDLDGNEPLGILYSSGTTGEAKGVLLSHNNILTNLIAAQTCYEMKTSDRTVLFLPLSHCFGLNAILNCITFSGASMLLLRRFTLPMLLQILKEDVITMFFGVPFIYNLLLKELTDDTLFDRTTYFFSAASKLPLSTEIIWENRFDRPIYQGYGLTETSPFASYVPRGKYFPGSIGVPVSDVQILISDDKNIFLPPNSIGEIVIGGPNVMLGYYNKPELTASVKRNGWFYTGDVGMIDDQGLLYIIDRIKDMVIVKGENVYPSEVENVILELPFVEEVAVYGIPDELSEERVCARIVLNKTSFANADDILQHCKKHLAPFKQPTILSFVESLPKSPSGKVLKRLLREEDLTNQFSNTP